MGTATYLVHKMQSCATSSTLTGFFYCANSLIIVHVEKVSVKKVHTINAQRVNVTT